MRNLKHTLAAFLAVVMVGTLAVNQAADITGASADRAEKTVTEEVQTAEESDLALPVAEVEEAPAQPAAPEKIYVNITEGALNVRSAPDQESEVLGQVACMAELSVIAKVGDWYEITYQEANGYVSAQYVTESYEIAKAAYLENFAYESGLVNADGVNIRDAAGTEGTNVIDQVDTGDLIVVLERVDAEWLKVYYGRNYDIGYMLASFVNLDDMLLKEDVINAKKERTKAISQSGIVVSGGSELNVRAFPNENAAVVSTLSDGAKCTVVKKGSKWTKIALNGGATTAYVKSDYILTDAGYHAQQAEKQRKAEAASASKKTATKKTTTSTQTKTVSAPATPSASGQAIVNEAEKYLGVRYVYGGTSPSGFDCSGLVQYVCRKLGISVNRSSKAQYSNGVSVSRENLQPGDLVFFSKGAGISHVVIYAGNGSVIHAPSPGKKVCYTTLDHICSYSKYVGARRVV